MEQGKKIFILLILLLILIILFIWAYIKYLPKEENIIDNNVSEVEKDNKKETNKNQEIVNKLYKMVSITDTKTDCLDYYLNNQITLNNISNDLVSYLVIKNIDYQKDNLTISMDNLNETLLKIFNSDKLVKEVYQTTIDGYLYTLEYDSLLNEYSLSKEATEEQDYKLTTKIIDSSVKEEQVIIKEEYELDLNDEDSSLNKGTITYTFNLENDNYYLTSIEREENNAL